MLKTPPGVAWPFDPVLTLERPMRMPLRYTCMVCSGTLTRTTRGPLGEICGFHQYSPGLSGPVGRPVGVPAVCAEGLFTAWADISRAIETARRDKNFMSDKETRSAMNASTRLRRNKTFIPCRPLGEHRSRLSLYVEIG